MRVRGMGIMGIMEDYGGLWGIMGLVFFHHDILTKMRSVILIIVFLPVWLGAQRPGFGDVLPYGYSVFNREIRLSWWVQAEAKIQRVDIFRKPLTGEEFSRCPGLWKQKYQGDSLFIEVVDTSLRTLGAWYYRIQLTDSLGRRSKPSPAILADNLTRQSAPHVTEFGAEGLSDQRAIRLHWRVRNLARVRSILVFRSDRQDDGYAVVAELPPGDTSYLDRVPRCMEAWHYFIGLRDVHGEIIPSLPFFGICTCSEKPTPPLELRAESTPTGVQLSWRRGSPNTFGYQIYRGPAGADQLSLLVNYLPADTSDLQVFEDSSEDLRPGTWYAYEVRSVNDAHEAGEAAGPVVVRCGKALLTTAPILSGSRPDASEVRLHWDLPPDERSAVDSWELLRSSEGEGELSRIAVLPANETVWEDRSVPAGIPVLYSVRAIDIYGQTGPPSEAWMAPPAPVEVPVLLARVNDRKVELHWSAPPGATGLLYRSRDGEAFAILKKITGQLSYTDSAVEPGTTYHYFLKIVLASGAASEPSEVVTVRM